jgi:hypothetical protein
MNHSDRVKVSALLLASMLRLPLAVGAHDTARPDVLSIKSIEMKSIGYDLNGDFYDYLFVTDAGKGFEIRPLAGIQMYLVMKDSYNPKHPFSLEWPYEAMTVNQAGEGRGEYWYICRLLEQSAANLPAHDARVIPLRQLVNEMEGLSSPPSRFMGHGGFGIIF